MSADSKKVATPAKVLISGANCGFSNATPVDLPQIAEARSLMEKPESQKPSRELGGHFPEVWRFWCWLTTEHTMTLRYADYLNDISGMRCRCGLKWKDNR